MPRIIILNVEHVSERAIFRHLWLADEGDIIISPLPIEGKYVKYVTNALGLPSDSLSIIAGDRRLTDEYLAHGLAGLEERLRELMPRAVAWDLMPCLYTEGIADLAVRLGLPLTEGLLFAAQRGPEMLNRKSHFRQLAIGAGLPIADGSIARDRESLAAAIERHLPVTGTVIVKRDDGNGGRGNITLTSGEPTPLPGTRETRAAGANLGETAAQLWEELTDSRNSTLVVEAYYDSTYCFYFEFVTEPHGRPVMLNSGSFHRRPDADPEAPALVWVGLDLPADIPPFSAVEAASVITRIVDLVSQAGYRGYINVDAILTEEYGLIVNEINARWGGGLVLDAVGRRLIGPRYADSHVVSGVRDIEPITLEAALEILAQTGLLFSSIKREGIVVLGYDPSLRRGMECAVVAADRPRSREIEAEFRAAIREGLR